MRIFHHDFVALPGRPRPGCARCVFCAWNSTSSGSNGMAVGTWRDILAKSSPPHFCAKENHPTKTWGWAIWKGLGILESCIAVWTMITSQQLEWDDFGEIANPKSPIKKSFWLNNTCHGHEWTHFCHSLPFRVWGKLPLSTAAAACERSLRLGKLCLDDTFLLPVLIIVWFSSCHRFQSIPSARGSG